MTLAVGIAANVAIFSVVSGVLLRPLPYQHPERLVFLWEGTPKFPDMSVSFPDFDDWRKTQHTFVDIAASRQEGYTLSGLGSAERVSARMTSANFFRVLGVQPALGRDFLDAEEQPNAPPVVIVSDKFWRERMNADAGAIGRTLLLNDRAFSIVGILPPSFRFHDDAPIYVTLAHLDALTRGMRGSHPGMYGIGRLKDGVTIEQARADMQTIGRAIQIAAGKADSEVLPKLWPLQSKEVEDVRSTLWLLLGAVAFVLLIASANVANLMLARGTARSRELAVRAALGADRWALMRPLLIESALIAVVGGALGVIAALWGVDLLVALKPDSIPRSAVIKVDRVVLAYSLGLTTVTALLCGLVPAFRASHADVNDALKAAGSRSVAGLAHGRLRSILVVAEVALALVLLVGAGLSLRTFRHLSRVDVGFRSDDVLTTMLSFSPKRYDTPEKVRAVFGEIQRRLEAAPGVQQAALSAGIPFTGGRETSFYVARSEGRPLRRLVHHDARLSRHARHQAPRRARLRNRRRRALDRGLPRRRVAGAEVLRQRRRRPRQAPVLRERDRPNSPLIIGVTRHVLHYGLEGVVPAQYQMYTLLGQLPDKILPLVHDIGVVMHGPHAATLAGTARTALDAYDPEMPLSDVATMDQLIADSVGGRKFAMLLLGVFAIVALLLAVVGLYAVMSYMVTQRYHEIGVRMALGANPGDVQRMVVRQGLTLVGIGLALGLATSLALARVMAALVSGVSASDPVTLAAVALMLTIAATLASLIPARAATRVDPMVVLRYE